MKQKAKKLGQVLLEQGLIDEFKLKRALQHQQQWGKPLGESLLDMGFIDHATLMQILGSYFQVVSINLDTTVVTPSALACMPREVAEKHHCIPVEIKNSKQGKSLVVAMIDPTDVKILDDLQFRLGMKITPVVGTTAGIQS